MWLEICARSLFPFWRSSASGKGKMKMETSAEYGAQCLTFPFLPALEGFQKGLYLAGVECNEDAQAPDGWTKWVIPDYGIFMMERENDNTFSEVIQYEGQWYCSGRRSP